MNNITLKKTVRVATAAGGAIVVLNGVMSLMSVSSPKGAIMPIVNILVGIAAFNYAISTPAVAVTTK